MGNICCQDLQGFYLQFILLTTSFRLLWSFFFFPFKIRYGNVHLLLLGNTRKVKEREEWVESKPKVSPMGLKPMVVIKRDNKIIQMNSLS